ncbi:MAG TPA: MerR family DNA-binding transcriptional regulator [Solirubrobacteraceae bacterium]|nr:MerR family DNA-binding transcriptional regulator [Solirubrobacteraceae bacterium]
MDDATLIPIGALARLTGLSVRTLRFYSDSGLLAPAGRSDADYRLYDAGAAARAELVRTRPRSTPRSACCACSAPCSARPRRARPRPPRR